jgi:hypothetical protein
VHAFQFSNCPMVVESSFIYLFVYIDTMFDSRYFSSSTNGEAKKFRKETVKQLEKLRQEGINGGHNFQTWFKEYVNPDLL